MSGSRNSIKNFIIGIDEVGRGPLAGPVVVCALAMPRELRIRNKKLGKLRDSKKLTAKQREGWCKWIKANPRIFYAAARVYPRRIERFNISQAANIAATCACLRLFKKLVPEPFEEQRYTSYIAPKIKVLLDGGLYLKLPPLLASRYSQKTIVRGDEKFTCIKLASIIAKVTRDAFMNRLHKKFPQYGFASHKGYGTAAHFAAIKKHGPSPVHRKTFMLGL